MVSKVRAYDFVRPMGGMFVWVRFDFKTHPLSDKIAGPRLARALWILWTTPKYRVLVSPGTIFAPNDEIRERDAWECFRLCFAAVDADQLAGINHRFVDGIKAFWEITDVKEIDRLLAEDEAMGADTAEMTPDEPSSRVTVSTVTRQPYR
ncbi:hypothetical protein LTS18_004611 [Coniosporium uncinatum]|uniref:Uncharacterized protein n=1 Tax=Coniosporium uncinatum TaxID=93489 RepID=A0ACC3D5K8_9PEZI|nr:hypothetical protein LTS18_004611 [Coniosporium uncinatum]